MQFSDTTNNSGLVQDCEFLVFGGDYGRISGDTELLQQFTHLLNEGLNKATIKIMESDTRWQWDDPNHADYPIAQSNLVNGQQDYTLEFSATDSHMKIDRVEIKTPAGKWERLKPIDLADTDQAQAQLFDTNNTPKYYDKLANSVFLYPAPNYDSTNGIKIFYQRQPSYFETSDTTKRAGIPTPFHRLVSLYACEDFTVAKTMLEKRTMIKEARMEKESDLQAFFGKRDKEDRPKLAPALSRQVSFK